MYTFKVYMVSMNNDNLWRYGEKAALAKAAGLSEQQVLTDFLRGDKNFSVAAARRLEAASIIVRGYDRSIPAAAWLRLEKHPALERGA